MSDYHIIITDAGAALEAAAHAAGTSVSLTAFGVCDGGTAFTPDTALNALPNEIDRWDISSLSVSADDPSVLVAQCIIPASSGGYTIRGIGIYAGDTLYAIGNYPDQPKPAPDSGYAASLEILAQLAVSDTADVTLNVTDGAWLTKEEGDQLYVPLTRTINGLALNSDVTLSASDVGALSVDGGTVNGDLAVSGAQTLTSSASAPTTLTGASPCILFSETDTGKKYYLVADGSNIRLNEDSTAGTVVWSWDAKNKTFQTGGTFAGSLSGNAATATKLATARKVGGVAFDGTADINLPGVNTQGNQNTTGNAATATKLATARKVGGVAFDGTADINLPGVNAQGNQSTTGNAASATKLQTARTINGVAFDGTANITISASAIGSYTKTESDSRYLQDYRLGSQGTITSTVGGNSVSPTGCTMTGYYTDGSANVNKMFYRPHQKNKNGQWVTISQL